MSEQPSETKESGFGKARGNPGQKWQPTDEEREICKYLAGAGASLAEIALHLGRRRANVEERLADEIAFGEHIANLGLKAKLIKKAMGSGINSMDGDTAALIYALKVRLGLWDRPPAFSPHPNDIPASGGNAREEVSVQVTYRYSRDSQALPPPPADRLPPPQTVEAEAKPA
jgi:hypothetical protein